MAKTQDIHRQALRERLRAIAADRLSLAQREAELREEFYEAIREANAAGIPVAEIAKLGRIARWNVYKILKKEEQ